MTRILPHASVSGAVMCTVVKNVPFPLMPFFFRKNGQNVLLNPDRLDEAIQSGF